MDKSQNATPYHELLFDEISGKLQELESRQESQMEIKIKERMDRLYSQLNENQNSLIEKIRGMGLETDFSSDLNLELANTKEQLESERKTNTKLSMDLAKSLDFNLKLQFENEELKKKIRDLSHEESLRKEELRLKMEKMDSETTGLKNQLQELMAAIDHFEIQSQRQSENVKSLTEVAEKKLIELKMALDKKVFESTEQKSVIQKLTSQLTVLRQENLTLKDYVQRMTALHERNFNPPTV